MENYESAFCEFIINKKITVKEVFIRIGIIILGVVAFAVFALFGLAPLGIILGGWFSWFYFNGRRTEWEYSLKGNVLDIYRISGKSRRRKMIPLELTQLEKFGKVGDKEYNHQLNIRTRVLDFTSLDKAKKNDWYYAVVQRPKGKFMVIIEPDERTLTKMLDYIPKYL